MIAGQSGDEGANESRTKSPDQDLAPVYIVDHDDRAKRESDTAVRVGR